ncbi:MgtC/SapB family protein [Guptibacillus algicola]|uniref:MgtC/SapB family protein n=1 Tax=Guptibacillus algicola TaxID=225844 RepID=UPI001CD5A2D5|nr:MgtC/SapB family protein [Alkalihalobacillus algicola]MCA0987398.1 hypothetical protein [Alkalihalobacillus algicola]
MKPFINNYSHWIMLVIVGFSLFTMILDFEASMLGIAAVVMCGIGFLSLGFVTIIVEKNKRKQKHHQ